MHGLPREVINAKWYAIYNSEKDSWHIRTSSLPFTNPFGYLIAEVEFQTIADHIVETHNNQLKTD